MLRAMSFELLLEVPQLTWAQAETIAAHCAGPGMLAVDVWPKRGWLRPQAPSLTIRDCDDTGRHLLAEDAKWDTPAWKMDPAVVPLLAATVQCLCRQAPQGFSLRATWSGDPLRHRLEVSCHQLLAIVRSSAMNTHTQYRVHPQ
jgi:hypothetical protein